MNSICRDIFKAIHEGRWLSIEYQNKQGEKTKYWIGIRNLNPVKKTMSVEGLHLGYYSVERFDCIYIDSICSSQVLEGTYYPVNEQLVQDIYWNPNKYKSLFDSVANLKILNYLEDCHRMDSSPYKLDFSLVKFLDRQSFRGDYYHLSEDQYRKIISDFQIKSEKKREETDRVSNKRIQSLAMNVMSIYTPKGLYVLAYRKLDLDVKRKCLRPDEDITVCTEFTIDGMAQSVRRFLDAEDYDLLHDFEKNQEKIKDAIVKTTRGQSFVDDMPYIIGLGRDVLLDLHSEYSAIINMYQRGEVSIPIKAFFGDLLDRPRSGRAEPMALLNKQVNLDQLLAINNAIKYPVAYVQGPPGTGKTNTIINTIVTAYFNEKTVLFASNNNHPIDGVVDKLRSMKYKGRTIPFPILRLGNRDCEKKALEQMRVMYEQVAPLKIYEGTLERNRGQRIERAKALSGLLKKYEDILDLRERKETIDRMVDYQKKNANCMELFLLEDDMKNRQMQRIEKELNKIGTVTNEDALCLLEDDVEELKKYLYYISAKRLQRIGAQENTVLKNILYLTDEEKQLDAFETYLKGKDNIRKLQKIFPIIATTCISAHKLGEPEVMFDMTIMDEASQCNTAVSLVPIIRGKKLMLVGDPQQLNPVILLDEVTNQKLRKKYLVTEEYDYRKNSVYKTYLSCDAVSDEVLLRYHYRCNKKIIEFNNKKYYNSKLLVRTNSEEKQPLQFVNIEDAESNYKNTSPAEVEEIIKYASVNKDQAIGVITPFVNQKNLIEKRLKEENLENVSCGTVHAFQGDEKDVVLFSTAITEATHAKTYDWLKNNKELINVATSRAKNKLIVLSNMKNLERLHQDAQDDLYDLVQYVRTNGVSKVTPKTSHSRALGVKPFSTETEEAFLATLNHALDNIWNTQSKFSVEKEVAVAQVFENNTNYSDLFYSGRFDFVVYEKNSARKYPVLVIELDGKEHFDNEVVRNRDRKKQEICRAHQMELIRVENTYARRYQHVKEILEAYFKVKH